MLKSCRSLVSSTPPNLSIQKWGKSLQSLERSAGIAAFLKNLCKALMLRRNKWRKKRFSFFFTRLLCEHWDELLVLEMPLSGASPVGRNCSPSVFVSLAQISHIQLWLLSQCCVLFAVKPFPSLKNKLEKKKKTSFHFKLAVEDFNSRHDFN